MDDIATLQRPPPYPYRSRSASVTLPSYKVQRRPDEQTLVFQPLESRLSPSRYVYGSQSMSLDLGPRQHGVGLPAYGNNAIVQGTLVVEDLKHVADISLTITGKASYTILECGYPILQQSKTVLHHSAPLWSSSHSQPPRDTPTTFTVSFPLPTYARWSSSLLPPTTRFIQGNFRLTVTYEIAVQLTRSGKLRRDERLATEFAYAPRTIPDLSPSILTSCLRANENTLEQEENKSSEITRWKVANLSPLTTANDQASIQLYVPSPTSYPSGTSIPFRIVISSQLDPLSPSDALKSPDTVSVELVKLISLRIGKTPVVIECVVGRGAIWKAERTDDQGGLEVTGCIEGTKKGGESSWGLGSFVECSYIVRATVNLPCQSLIPSASRLTRSPASRLSPFVPLSLVRSASSSTSLNKAQTFITYRHDEPIHLCTDEVEAFEIEADDAWERPAMGLLPNGGDLRSSMQPTRVGWKGWQFLRRARLGAVINE